MKLDDRMKKYEKIEAGKILLPNIPICIRLDGRGFSKFTKDLKKVIDHEAGYKKPFDKRMSAAMIEVTKCLVKESNALIGYTQSDEITLILYTEKSNSEVLFNGKVQKLCSVLASLASVKFQQELAKRIPEKSNSLAHFDCRVWNVPTKQEACNVLLWREIDATRNSISMAAQSLFSHKYLHGKNTKEMQQLLGQVGIEWDDYPVYFKRGSYVQRKKVERLLTEEEREKIPANLRPDPDHKYVRTEYQVLDMPPFSSVGNRVEVVFEGSKPLCHCEHDEDVHKMIQEHLGGRP